MKSMNNPKQDRKGIGLMILFIGILILIYGYNVSSLNGPVILNDELGYWTHGSTLAGGTWYSALSEDFPWYSYGYSFIIAPIISLCSNLSSAYQIAIVINIILAISNFFLSYRIATKMFKQESRVALSISFICACYPSVMFQVKIAWSETFLSFMVWLALNLFINYLTTLKLSQGIICTLAIIGCYIVHNRTLGILCAYLIIIVLMSIEKKIDRYHLIVFVLLLLVCLIINKVMQSFLAKTEMAYYDGQSASYNGFSHDFEKLKESFTVEGFNNLILSFSGKLWYLFTASFLLAVFCFIDLITVQINIIGKWKKAYSNEYIFKTFIFLSVIFTIGISSIFMLDPFTIESNGAVRIDSLIYGRYTECLIGIIMLIGILSLFRLRKNTKKFVCICAGISLLYAFLTLALSSTVDCVENFYINIPNIVGALFLGVDEFSILKCGVFILFIFLLYVILNYLWRKDILICLYGALICIIFIYTGHAAVKAYVLFNQNSRYPLFGDFDKDILNFEGNIYLWGAQSSFVPLLMMDKPVYRITDGNIKNIEDNSLVIAPQLNSNIFILNDEFQLVVQGKGENVWIKSGEEKLYMLNISNIKRNLFTTPDSLLYADNEYVYWNSEKSVQILCNLPQRDLECSIDFGWGIPFEKINLTRLPVEIWINGQYISTIFLDAHMRNNTTYSFTINANVLQDGKNIMTLVPKATWSPAEYGSTDERTLTFPIKEITFIPI